jgi:predicted aspartyl protease
MPFDFFAEIDIHEESKMYVWLELFRGNQSYPIVCLLDTGATGTMVPKWVAEQIGVKYGEGKKRKVNGIAGHLNGRAHKVETALMDEQGKEIGRHAIDVTFVEGSDIALAGMNLITKFDWNLLFSKKKIEVTT